MNGSRGITLMEVLISIVLVGIMSASLFYFLGAQNKLGTRAGDLTKGMHLGKQKLDSLKVSDYDQIASGSDTVQGRYIRAWSITTQTGVGGLPTGRKILDVHVYWPLEAEHGVSLSTLLSDDQYKE